MAIRVLRRRRLGLRARIMIAFALGALLLSILVAATAYGLTRTNLIEGREEDAVNAVVVNAEQVNLQLSGESTADEIRDVLGALSTPFGGRPVVNIGEDWFAADTFAFSEADITGDIRAQVLSGTPSQKRYRVRGDPLLVVGIPLPELEATYFEAAPLNDVEDTLNSLALILFGAGAVTTLAGAATGFWASSRLLRPLHDVSDAAEAISHGELDTRLDVGGDRDLATLSQSFNEMAGALEERIERDARFASEVSHELRSPLMTLTASVEVLKTRRDELPERAQTALDLLDSEVVRFSQLVEDLLEISRFDVGVQSLETEEFLVTDFVRRAVHATGNGDVPVVYSPALEGQIIEADSRRLAQVLANLVDNADKYAAGATRVTIARRNGAIEIGVEDDGPGVRDEEKPVIFDRFSRGSEGGRRGAGTGVGLGLALVREHLTLHGGEVWVEDLPDERHGARFVVRLPGVTR